MGAFGIGGDSTAKTTNTTVTDQGQNVGQKANVAQSGSVQAINSSLAPTFKNKGSVTFTQGVTGSDLQSLLGAVTTATGNQIQAASSAQQNQLSALQDSIAQQQAQNPAAAPMAAAVGVGSSVLEWVKNNLTTVGAALVVAVLVVVWFRKKKT